MTVATGVATVLALALTLGDTLALALLLRPKLVEADGEMLADGEPLGDCDGEQAPPGQPQTVATPTACGAPAPSVCADSTVSVTGCPVDELTSTLPAPVMFSTASVIDEDSDRLVFHAVAARRRPAPTASPPWTRSSHRSCPPPRQLPSRLIAPGR